MRAFLIALTIVLTASNAVAERVALVIGNSNYAHTSALPNPANDARAIAEKLQGLGFTVDLHENLTGQGFRIALGEFTEKALRSELALVYYAGHAIEMGGSNYLIPVDARMESESTAQFEAISLDNILSSVRDADKLGMVLLDACRDNPFASTMRRRNNTRSLSRGLAPVSISQESGILVSFAAESGQTADDGDGMHSPYTQALLEVMNEPGLEIGRMFRKVRSKVRTATGGVQVPVERAQLPDEAIYLVPPTDSIVHEEPEDVVTHVPPREPEADPLVVYLAAVQTGERGPLEDFIARYPTHFRAEDARKLLIDMADRDFWQQTKTMDSESGYSTYLIAFPNGKFTADAKQRLEEIKAPPPPPPPTPQLTYSACPALNGGWSVTRIKTNDTLFVRNGPGTNYTAIGELPYNANGVGGVSCRSDGWCQVTYGCISGWSFGKYLQQGTGGQATSWFEGYYAVTDHPMDSKLNVRSGPGTNYDIVGELPPDARGVQVSDCQVEKGYRFRWCTVSWQGVSGWSYGRYLKNASGTKPLP